MAYLDHNATSPLRPEARAAMERAFAIGANASAIHRSGRAARAMIDDARELVASMVNADPTDVVFTSSGSEANALALWGVVFGANDSSAPIARLLVSAIEHESVLNTTAAIAERLGVESAFVPVTGDGVLDLGALERLLSRDSGRALIAVMAANNETGIIQPIEGVAALARAADALFLVDAVQACGKMALDFGAVGADFLSLSAHKFGGPQGAGALVMRAGAPFAPLLPGGQEKRLRAGTENVAAIAGFGAAAESLMHDKPSQASALRDRFEAALKSRFPDAIIFGEAALRLDNTSNFAIPQIAAETAVIALDLDGVMVSSGAACSSGKVQQSHVLRAMGVPRELAACGLRATFGWNSDEGDIDAALAALDRLVKRVRERKAA